MMIKRLTRHDDKPEHTVWRWRRPASKLATGVLLVIALSGCACRPGYIGPYGGVHPGRCFVG